MNIAITGSNGYIGSYLVSYFKNNYSVCEFSRKPSSLSQEKFVYFDLGNTDLNEQLRNIDVLIHCAYDFSQTDYHLNQKINVEGSAKLFKQAKEQGVKKIIFISSISAFPDAVSQYGRIKYAIETQAKVYGATIIRPGLVFCKNPRGIIGAINQLINISKIIPLVGDGKQQFYPCHKEDLANLLRELIENRHETSMPILAAAEKSLAFREIINELARAKQKSIWLIPLPYHFIYVGLKLVELLKIKIGLRSDSLKYMKYYNANVETGTKRLTTKFRSFNLGAD